MCVATMYAHSLCRSREGAWIEIPRRRQPLRRLPRRSREGAWIEIFIIYINAGVFPRRSREGAWIEMSAVIPFGIVYTVAPARERGLKSADCSLHRDHLRRSREGAWIEMVIKNVMQSIAISRSREGAWIEMPDRSR